MNYYLDTEFVESPIQPKFLGVNIGKTIFTIDLISIGIVSEDDREYYAISSEFDVDNAWNKINPTTHSNEKPYYWIRENVLKPIYDELFFKAGVDRSFPHKSPVFHNPKFTLKNFKILLKKYGKSRKKIAYEISRFVCDADNSLYSKWQDSMNNYAALLRDYKTEDNVKFYGYYADYDWVVFCWLYGRMMDLPKSFPWLCHDLQQMLDDVGSPNIQHIKDMNKNEHNALADAKFNKNLHDYINKL